MELHNAKQPDAAEPKMKTTMLLTVEFDPEAEVLNPHRVRDPFPLPPPNVLIDELNTELRQWAATNPFGLRDKEHLTLKLVPAQTVNVTAGGDNYGPKLASDLRRIAGDLSALAHITENL